MTPRRSQDRPLTPPRATRRTTHRQQPAASAGSRAILGPIAVIVVLGVLVLAAMPSLLPGGGSDDRAVSAAGAGSSADATAVARTPSPASTPGATAGPTSAPTPAPTIDPARAYATPVPAAQRRLDRAFATMAAEVGAPGLAAAVKLPDGTVWYGATGVLWPDGPEVTPDTPFAWGSITKTFVATLVLRLASEGTLDLDDKLSTWFPDYPQARRITLRMLLGHTSGIFDYFQHPDYPERVYDDPLHVWTPEEILSLTGKRTNAPGKAFSYSNTNYVLLGLILEQVTGEQLVDLVHDQLLAPLGLDETVFQQAGRDNGLVGAKGFWKRKGGGFEEWSDGTDYRPTTSTATVAWAAGAIEGSIRDLLDWEMALYEGDVLSPDALSEMLDFDEASGYGLGARTQTVAKRAGYGHGGSMRGFVSVMYRLPAEDLDVVVVTNIGFANLDRVANRLASATLAALATPEPTIQPAPSDAQVELQGDATP
ncbi:MAG: serine hydrolase [Chloroflexota bacterium]